MLQFLLKRLLSSATAVVLVSLLIFTLARLVPASPALLVLGPDAGASEIAAFEAKYGLNKPILEQYAIWAKGVITRFDFGVSYVSGRPIAQEVIETLPVTVELIVVS